jgi:hypothetical protein
MKGQCKAAGVSVDLVALDSAKTSLYNRLNRGG